MKGIIVIKDCEEDLTLFIKINDYIKIQNKGVFVCGVASKLKLNYQDN